MGRNREGRGTWGEESAREAAPSFSFENDNPYLYRLCPGGLRLRDPREAGGVGLVGLSAAGSWASPKTPSCPSWSRIEQLQACCRLVTLYTHLQSMLKCFKIRHQCLWLTDYAHRGSWVPSPGACPQGNCCLLWGLWGFSALQRIAAPLVVASGLSFGKSGFADSSRIASRILPPLTTYGHVPSEDMLWHDW